MDVDLSRWDVARLHSMCPPPSPAPPPRRTASPWAGIARRSASRRDLLKAGALSSQRAAQAVLAARSARVHAREVLHRKLEAESASFWLQAEERKAVEALAAVRRRAKERAPWRPVFDASLGMLTPSEQYVRHRERHTAGELYAEGCALAGDAPPEMEGAEKEERQLANELEVERKMAIEYDTTECARRMHVLEHNERSLLEGFTGKRGCGWSLELAYTMKARRYDHAVSESLLRHLPRTHEYAYNKLCMCVRLCVSCFLSAGKRSTRPAHSRTRYHAPASHDEARVALNLLHDTHGPIKGPSHGP
jgi:predicted ATPase